VTKIENNKVNCLLFYSIQSGEKKSKNENFTYILQLVKPRCPIAVFRLELKDIALNIL